MSYTWIPTAGMTRADWLRERKNGIGGSDAWRIILPPDEYKYAGCAELYRDKTTEEPDDEPESLPCRIGNALEQTVAELYEGATGRRVHRWNRMLTSTEHPYMRADIDRKLYGVQEGLECKTIGEFAARRRIIDPDTDEPRYIDRFTEGDMEASLSNKLEWYIQMQHYMAVTGWEMWHLAVLIGNRKFLWYDVPRDEEYIAEIIRAEKEFWEHVEARDGFYGEE